MNWIIIGLLIIAVLVLLKIKYIKHKIFLIAFLLVILFLYTSFSAIFIGNDVDLNSIDGLEKAVKLYFGWLSNAFTNLKSLTAQVVKMDWQTNKLDKALKVGDTIHIKGHTTDFEQKITSIQIEHKEVKTAKKRCGHRDKSQRQSKAWRCCLQEIAISKLRD